MGDLTQRHCKPCEGGASALSPEQAEKLLGQIPAWETDEGGLAIRREFTFKNFYQTMAFVNALAWIAHREDHHPDLEVGYRRCKVVFRTHAIGGLSDNDFICAAKVDRLAV